MNKPTELRTQMALGSLNLSLVAAVLTTLRDAAVAFQGPTETPAEAGQRAVALREAAELATSVLAALRASAPGDEG